LLRPASLLGTVMAHPERFETQIRPTLAHKSNRPRANGQIERMNRTIKEAIVKRFR
jgi:hypothetical protein